MFFYSNLLTALGYSLLNSIWQMALTWSFYYLLSRRNKAFTAAVRHDLILILCMVNVLWFVYSFLSSVHEPVTHLFPGFINSETSFQWIPFVSTTYLLILFFRIFNDGFQLYKQQKIRFNQGKSFPGKWEEFANRQARLLGISKKVRLLFSQNVETAETSGFLKPLILMPVSLITHLSPVQLEAIIVHELLHIRRNDFLINLMMNGYRHIFFFNPFACIFYRSLCHQRELACDDGVIERNISPQLYADALFRLEKHRQIPVVFTVAADGHKPWLLRERIGRLLGKPVQKHPGFNITPCLSILIALFLLGLSTQPNGHIFRQHVFTRKTAIIPVKFKMSDQVFPITRIFVGQKPGSLSYKRKVVMKQALQEFQELNSNVESVLPDLVQYTDHREAINFSNEQNAIARLLPPKTNVLTPYVPEHSFEFNPETINDQSDSLIQIRMKDVIAFTIIQKSVIKNQLKTAENKINVDLRNIENRKKVYQHFSEKNFQQLLQKLQDQIEQKKLEIDRINIQAQALDEEIIHI